MEFLVHVEQHIPPDTDPVMMADVKAKEHARGRELVSQGTIKRFWRVPGRRASYGLYDVEGPDQLHAILSSLPLFPWMDIEVIPLGSHQLDPESDRGEDRDGT
jgi:muconolactone D-isomerase